jgi:hypothetical protein
MLELVIALAAVRLALRHRTGSCPGSIADPAE